jgi:hypothetical protein
VEPDEIGCVDDEKKPLSLWNDDPRLRRILITELLPEMTGVRELGDFIADRIQREHLKSCVMQLHDEISRQQQQTIEQGARELISKADAIFHEQQNYPRRKGPQVPCSSQTIDALLMRYGLTGEPSITLDAMGKIIDRTRERARQIEDRHSEALRSTRPFWPALDNAIALVLSMAPCREDDLVEELIRNKLTTVRFSFKSLRACAEFGGRDFEFEETNGLIGTTSPELSAVIRSAKVISSRQGLASLLQISDEVLHVGLVMSEEDVRAILRLMRQVVWLDDDHVTWSEVPRNRLVNTLRTMLAVHQPVEIEVVLQAITDFWSYRNAGRAADQPDLVSPTSESLVAFCSWHPDFEVDARNGVDAITSTVDLDVSAELGLEAAMLVEVIRSSPDSAFDRITLIEAAEAVGMKSTTVGIYLSFHPAFINPARNIWTTLGTDLKDETIERLQGLAQQRSRSEARDFTSGLTSDGHPWVALAVTSNLRMCGAILRKWLPNYVSSLRFSAVDHLGDACGFLAYNADSGFTHGLGVYFRRFDITVGEFLLIIADLDWETVQIIRGDQALTRGPS